MSDFYDYLHGGQPASRELPVTNRRPAPPSPPPANPMSERMYNTALNNIEQMKQQLCEKIDVCCAQYGLYGLKVIDKAITDSLRMMINGVQQPQMPQQYAQPAWQQNENFAPAGYQQPVAPQQPQQPMSRDEMMFGGFVNNLDAILAECDKDVDKRAEEQMKQRLYEQKQADMMIAQNVDAARQNAQIDLSQHENDFVVESEQDLRSYV